MNVEWIIWQPESQASGWEEKKKYWVCNCIARNTTSLGWYCCSKSAGWSVGLLVSYMFARVYNRWWKRNNRAWRRIKFQQYIHNQTEGFSVLFVLERRLSGRNGQDNTWKVVHMTLSDDVVWPGKNADAWATVDSVDKLVVQERGGLDKCLNTGIIVNIHSAALSCSQAGWVPTGNKQGEKRQVPTLGAGDFGDQ